MKKRIFKIILLVTIFVMGLSASTIYKEMNLSESVNVGEDTKGLIEKEQPTPYIMPSLTPITIPVVSPTPVPLKYLNIKKYPVAVYKKESEPVQTEIKPVKLRYLKENGISIDKEDLSELLEGKSFKVSYPRISGLINTEIQEKVNREFKNFASDIILYGKENKDSLVQIQTYFQVGVNANNLLSITFQTQYYNDGNMFIDIKTFVYELITGKRLELGDLFGKSNDYVKLLNNLARTYLLEHNLDEAYLKKPFQGIREEQAFYLSESKFYLKIDMKNDEFVNNLWYLNPLDISADIKNLPGLCDIYKRYTGMDKIYMKDSNKRIYLPNDIEIKPAYKSELVRNKYNIQVTGLEFSKTGNTSLEKALNEWCKPVIPEDFKKEVLKADDKAGRMSFYNKRYDVRANFMDYLCITSSEEQNILGSVVRGYNWDAVSYNIKSGKKLKLQDLFVKGFDYKKALEEIALSGKQGNPRLTADDISKVLDGNPKFFFDLNNLVIDVSLNSSTEVSGSQKSLYVTLADLGKDNIIFNTIE